MAGGPIVEYLISWQHALRMQKKLNIKRHRPAGYSIEVEDTKLTAHGKLTTVQQELVYSDYKTDLPLFRIKVFREVSE
jgi:hypothetical protein